MSATEPPLAGECAATEHRAVGNFEESCKCDAGPRLLSLVAACNPSNAMTSHPGMP